MKPANHSKMGRRSLKGCCRAPTGCTGYRLKTDPLEDDQINRLSKTLPTEVIDRYEQLKKWSVPEDTYHYLLPVTITRYRTDCKGIKG